MVLPVLFLIFRCPFSTFFIPQLWIAEESVYIELVTDLWPRAQGERSGGVLIFLPNPGHFVHRV